MKRGLKRICAGKNTFTGVSSPNPGPDEEGIETDIVLDFTPIRHRPNPGPDEEGIETDI